MQTSMQCGKIIAPPSDALSMSARRPAGCVPRRHRGGLQVVAAVKRGSDKTIVCSKTVIAKTGSEAAVQDLCKQVSAVHFALHQANDGGPFRADFR
jgi:hypothetical protein